ncbi:MAG: hypothetical protein IKP08_06025 [Bacteroidales bacterium]|nr:hypothetical protein [Bacteroidales bacterium]
MREPKNDLTRLEHILEAISYVESYTNGITEQVRQWSFFLVSVSFGNGTDICKI